MDKLTDGEMLALPYMIEAVFGEQYAEIEVGLLSMDDLLALLFRALVEIERNWYDE